jgi:hypothetical protein
VQHDYRRVFATILQDWLGAGNSVLDLTFYDNTNATGFAGNKVNQLINSANTVPPSCYSDGALSSATPNAPDELIVYSNPRSETFTIHALENINAVSIYSIDGRFMGKFTNPQSTNNYSIPVHQLSVGVYTLVINTNQGNHTKKIIVRR